jgi:hypothetical protein
MPGPSPPHLVALQHLLHCRMAWCAAIAALQHGFMLHCNGVLRRNILQCNIVQCNITYCNATYLLHCALHNRKFDLFAIILINSVALCFFVLIYVLLTCKHKQGLHHDQAKQSPDARSNY